MKAFRCRFEPRTAFVAALMVMAAQFPNYNVVGIQPYCNVDPVNQLVQCNYESAAACLSYLEAGQRCVGNHDYIGDLPGGKRLSNYSSAPELEYQLHSLWQSGR